MAQRRTARAAVLEALGATAPTFAHHNLLTTATGEGLSKRLGHLSLAALREAGEEASVPADACELLFEAVLDLGYWSYTTVVMRAVRAFEPVIADPESLDLQWVSLDEVSRLPLHPRFGESWPQLRSQL